MKVNPDSYLDLYDDEDDSEALAALEAIVSSRDDRLIESDEQHVDRFYDLFR